MKKKDKSSAKKPKKASAKKPAPKKPAAKKPAPKKPVKKIVPKKATAKPIKKKVVKQAVKVKTIAKKPVPKAKVIPKKVAPKPDPKAAKPNDIPVQKPKRAAPAPKKRFVVLPPRPLVPSEIKDDGKNTKGLYKLEYVVTSSPDVLFEFLSTAGGLEKWFAPRVYIKDAFSARIPRPFGSFMIGFTNTRARSLPTT